jgi:hypothetical protein
MTEPDEVFISPKDPKLPHWSAQPVDAEELRFTKRQQWYVAGSVAAVDVAAYTLLKGSPLRGYEACVLASVFIMSVAGAGIFVLWHLQNSMRPLRQDQRLIRRGTARLTFFGF